MFKARILSLFCGYGAVLRWNPGRGSSRFRQETSTQRSRSRWKSVVTRSGLGEPTRLFLRGRDRGGRRGGELGVRDARSRRVATPGLEKRDSMKIGDKVIVKGFQARNGSHMADGRRVTLADGLRILYRPGPKF